MAQQSDRRLGNIKISSSTDDALHDNWALCRKPTLMSWPADVHTSRGKPPASRKAACRGRNMAALRASPCSAFRPCSCRDSSDACSAQAARRQNSSSIYDEPSLQTHWYDVIAGMNASPSILCPTAHRQLGVRTVQ